MIWNYNKGGLHDLSGKLSYNDELDSSTTVYALYCWGDPQQITRLSFSSSTYWGCKFIWPARRRKRDFRFYCCLEKFLTTPSGLLSGKKRPAGVGLCTITLFLHLSLMMRRPMPTASMSILSRSWGRWRAWTRGVWRHQRSDDELLGGAWPGWGSRFAVLATHSPTIPKSSQRIWRLCQRNLAIKY